MKGDSLHLLGKVGDNSVDCIVTDPPYGISFMSREWDKAVPDVAIWKECLRVLKPGAFAFVMCSPRSDVQAEMTIKLKEAGFEVGFTPIYWTYASGFPKALNVAKAIDRRFHDSSMRALHRFVYDEVFRSFGIPQGLYARLVDHRDIAIGEVGFEPIVVGRKPYTSAKADSGISANSYGISGGLHPDKPVERVVLNDTIPATEEARKLDGSYTGFQPKPSIEVVLVAMKPLSEKNYVDQSMKNGKGVTWLDDGRIPYQSEKDKNSAVWGNDFNIRDTEYEGGWKSRGKNLLVSNEGRFPANLLVQDDVLDNGIISKSGPLLKKHTITKGQIGSFTPDDWAEKEQHPSKDYPSDEGSISRYFSLDAWYTKNIEKLPDYVQRIFPFLYVPKPSDSERNSGLENIENVHPTVKPIKLMTYLMTIGSRPGDTVLDPFMGSGSSGVAAHMIGRKFIGFEIDGTYFEIAQRRIESVNVQRSFIDFIDDSLNGQR